MSEYKMEIKGEIGLSDYSNIYDYIGVVDTADNFTITLDSSQAENLDIICSMLKDNKFNILYQGEDSQGNYFINAIKKKWEFVYTYVIISMLCIENTSFKQLVFY